MIMKNKLLIFAVAFLCLSLNSCSDEKDGPSEKQLVTNAGVMEDNQTVKPGDIVHIYGDGFQEGDEVDLDVRWDTGELLIPEGFISFVSAEIVERNSNGISIRMPYRKPESRVKILLSRASDRMTLGKVLLKDGQTPKDFRLYGINNDPNTVQVAWADSKENVTGSKPWDMSAYPDFHSVVNLEKTYGLCGLAKENGVTQPFFFDFCTGEWKKLGYYSYGTLALTDNGLALQLRNKGRYSLQYVTSDLERCNYATKTRMNIPIEQFGFELPGEFTPEQFGDYPGVSIQGKKLFLLSANKGEGKWTLVLYDAKQGFFPLEEEIEADALIPFYFGVDNPVDGSSSQHKMVGYVISSSVDKGGSRFCLFAKDKNSDKLLLEEPFATLPNKVISITNRLDRPGTFTVLSADENGKRTISDYDYNTKEWKLYDELSDVPYGSIVWAN